MSYMETYKEWCTNPYFDENTKAELAAIGDDAAEIEDRFYRQLEFGTGGLRGVIGAGTNWRTTFSPRTDRRRVLRSPTIPESCPPNLRMRRRSA